ncbi:MAG: hypothetical protein F6K35_40730 [Okeania sp. SIO2H7]|nr:hypothetical protein [Okeania sp. SIO2H7]
MKDLKDLSNIIANKGDNLLSLSSVNLQQQEDVELDRQLREIKFKQELRKDWFLFILKDVIVFSSALLFILAVGGYSLFILIRVL